MPDSQENFLLLILRNKDRKKGNNNLKTAEEDRKETNKGW